MCVWLCVCAYVCVHVCLGVCGGGCACMCVFCFLSLISFYSCICALCRISVNGMPPSRTHCCWCWRNCCATTVSITTSGQPITSGFNKTSHHCSVLSTWTPVTWSFTSLALRLDIKTFRFLGLYRLSTDWEVGLLGSWDREVWCKIINVCLKWDVDVICEVVFS